MNRSGGPEISSKKTKDFNGSIMKLLVYCKPYVIAVAIALILACAGAILNVMGPDKIKDMTSIIEKGLMSGIDMEELGNVGFFLLTIYSIGFVFNYIQGFIMATVTQKVSKSLRHNISNKINKLPFKYFDNTSYGDVLSRVTNDVDTISMTLNNSLGSLVTSVTTFLGALIMMFYTNVLMSVSAIVSTIIGFALMMFIIKNSQKHFISQQRELGKINGHIEEIYSGHNVVKAYNGEKNAIEAFNKINDRLYNSGWKSQFMSGLMMPLMGFIGNFGYVVVCVVGAALVHNGSIPFSTIVAFMIYIRMFTNPLSQIAQVANNMQSTVAAAERVFEFIEEKEIEEESYKTTRLEVEDLRGDVEFKNVIFGYDKDRMIINDFSVKTKAGQKIAIVGPTGAGKTTIVKLLMRFYDVNEGAILVDGYDIRDFNRGELRQMFGMVLQDTWLFNGSIRENIRYGKLGASDEEVKAAAKAAHAHHFIKTLPDSYNMELNEEASNVSQGQKQLLTIARAILADPKILILDEATSSVDTRTEVLIQKAMDNLMEGRTSFIIAHRLSTIRNADLILVMDNGDIVEQGSHDELIEQNGFYSNLYNSQFDKAI